MRKKNGAGGINLSDLRLSYKVTEILRSAKILHRMTSIDAPPLEKEANSILWPHESHQAMW